MVCQSPNCSSITRGRQKLCKTCTSRLWRIKNPERASFLNLKSNSKKRNIPFLLTFEQFQQFCVEYNYIEGKGRSKTSYTIDRIRNEEGYHIDNLQVLPNSQNASKGTKKLEAWWDEQENKIKFVVTTLNKNRDNSNCPF